MNLRSELQYAFYPRKSLKFWAAIYLVLIVAILAGLWVFASHIRTRISPTGGIALTTNYSEYVIGEPIIFTVTNNYNSSIDFTTQCPAEPLAVYKEVGSAWVRLHGNADKKSCVSEPRQTHLPPLSAATSSLAPWKGMFSEPGAYRLVAIVNGSKTLPYVDIDIINPPVAIVHQLVVVPTPSGSTAPKVTTAPISTSPSLQNTQSSPPNPPPPSNPPPARTPQTYTLTVNSSGNYSPTTLVLYHGDSIHFVYSAPIQNEVRTRFTAISPTTTILSSVTLDSEFKTRTVTYTAVGSWKYKADDHSGNSGTLTVN